MKLTIETNQLKAALSRAGCIVGTRTTLPILSGVLLSVKEGVLKLLTTNLDIWVAESLPCSDGTPGETVVSFKLLNSFVGAASTTCAIEADEKVLRIRSGERVAEFEVLPAVEFPPEPEVKGKPSDCMSEELRAALIAVEHAMSDDHTRYTLMGVSVEANGSGTDIIATNGRVFARYEPSFKVPKDTRVILPSQAIRAILKVLSEGSVGFLLSDGYFRIEHSTGTITGKLVEGEYPNWKAVMPDASTTFFHAQREELLSAVSTAAMFLDVRELGVHITGKGREIEVSCGNRFREKLLGSELTPQPKQKILVDNRYLRDTLSAMTQDEARLELSSGNFIIAREPKFTGVIGLMGVDEK